MPRGGKRVGAGRPSIADESTRFSIGLRCQRLQDRIAKLQRAARLKQILARQEKHELDQHLAVLRSASRHDRARIVLLSAMSEADREAAINSLPVRFANELEDGVEALIGRRETLDQIGRGISNPVRTPQGFNRRIIAKVASLYSRRLGRPVSTNYVDECWYQYRSEFPKRTPPDDVTL